MFSLANELFIAFGLYLLFSVPFTETEYIGLKCLCVVLLLFYFLVIRVGGGYVPSWFIFFKGLLDPLVARVSATARRLRAAILL